jgi:hypothetical protein
VWQTNRMQRCSVTASVIAPVAIPRSLIAGRLGVQFHFVNNHGIAELKHHVLTLKAGAVRDIVARIATSIRINETAVCRVVEQPNGCSDGDERTARTCATRIRIRRGRASGNSYRRKVRDVNLKLVDSRPLSERNQ